MERAIEPSSLPQRILQRMDLGSWLHQLPLTAQVLVTIGLGLLLVLCLTVPDFIPLIDEVVAGWLFFLGLASTARSLKDRRARAQLDGAERPVLAADALDTTLPDLEHAEALALDPAIVEMTMREMDHLDPELVQEAIAELSR
jgi:hypothetical protein